jgi:hypothetical protein
MYVLGMLAYGADMCRCMLRTKQLQASTGIDTP